MNDDDDDDEDFGADDDDANFRKRFVTLLESASHPSLLCTDAISKRSS